MSEIKVMEALAEQFDKLTREVGYNTIKPESVISHDEAKDYLNSLFDNSGDSLGNGKDSGDHKITEENAQEIKKALTDEEKTRIKCESGWSDEIIDSIGSMKEYEIYKNADLQESEIDGKKCLIKSDIDWDQKDEMGRTNKERVESKPPDGPLSPISKNGESLELHHIGQKSDSPLAELTKSEHIKNGNYSILHDTQKNESEINRSDFNKEKRDYWRARANQN